MGLHWEKLAKVHLTVTLPMSQGPLSTLQALESKDCRTSSLALCNIYLDVRERIIYLMRMQE